MIIYIKGYTGFKTTYTEWNFDIGTLTLSPRSGIELGGNKVFINGPCYNPEHNIVCRFNRVSETRCVYITSILVYCITPLLRTHGQIVIELSLDGGSTYNYNGVYRSSKFILI